MTPNFRKTKAGITIILAAFLFSFASNAEAGRLGSSFGDFTSKNDRRRKPNIVEYVVKQNERRGKFDTLIAALSAVSADPQLPDLIGTLSNDGPFTVFAPTDNAFAKLGLNSTNIGSALPLSDLSDILLYHVAAGKKKALNLLFEQDIQMLNGSQAEFNFSIWPFGFFINDSKVIDANNRASNGIVHVIDAVLLPPPPEPTVSFARLSVMSVPEPSALWLSGGAFFSIILICKRRRLRS